jgi:pimeloyl-ACP methyl ester carboxylesterase
MTPLGKLLVLAAGLSSAGATAVGPGAVPTPDPTLLAYASTTHSVRLADGRFIHFFCMGRGSPTVILTAGLGDWGISWSTVQPQIAKTTRACAWDRPGFGLSDAAPGSQSVATTTADLEAALAQPGLHGPYVMVGHSLGSFESLLFADRHPGDVAGMVLVDPAVPDQMAMMRRVAPATAASSESYAKGLIALVRQCVARLRNPSSASASSSPPPDCDFPYPPTYPPELIRLLKAHAKPMQGGAVASFYENEDLSSRQVINSKRNYGAMPLVVLTATDAPPPRAGTPADVVAETQTYLAAFSREHDALAALSTRGVNARVPGTTHYIHQIKPQVVIDAIDQVVAEARAAKR